MSYDELLNVAEITVVVHHGIFIFFQFVERQYIFVIFF